MKKTCLGFPIKLGRMKMRYAKRFYRGTYVAGMSHFKLSDYNKLGFKVGDLAHDCDGFNHRIAKIEPLYYSRLKRGKILGEIAFYKEDGTTFCHACSPLPKQQIDEWLEYMKANRANDQWNFMDRYEEVYGKDFTINEDGTVNKGKR
jgi:hypothetical protein